MLRIDDLDTPRNVNGAADNILKTLENFGLFWDDAASYQSQCIDVYNDVLDTLRKQQLIYPCTCSRKTLSPYSADTALANIYPGFCRHVTTLPDRPYSLRIKTDERMISFKDSLHGLISQNMAKQHGDFVIKRKDHIIAYQFAVVIDDNLQHINHIVRGIDLLDSTAKQIYLQQLLGLPTPHYMHVPVIIDQQGYKLSKQTLAASVDNQQPQATLFKLLDLLNQHPPTELASSTTHDLLDWAIAHWNPTSLKDLRTILQTID